MDDPLRRAESEYDRQLRRAGRRPVGTTFYVRVPQSNNYVHPGGIYEVLTTHLRENSYSTRIYGLCRHTETDQLFSFPLESALVVNSPD